MIVNGHDATDELRTETAGAAASAIASMPSVREALVAMQLGFRKAPGLVADGRDMGTVIFPDAPFKVFLTASAAERAKRRYKQLKEKGLSVTLGGLQREIEARDSPRCIASGRAAQARRQMRFWSIPPAWASTSVVAKVLAVVQLLNGLPMAVSVPLPRQGFWPTVTTAALRTAEDTHQPVDRMSVRITSNGAHRTDGLFPFWNQHD